MIQVLLALTLAAAAAPSPAARPTPIAPRQADFALHLQSPRASLPGLKAFLDRAGALAPALQPESLGRSLGGSAGANLLDLEALAAAGFDVDAPMTVALSNGALVSCLSAASPKAAERLDASLSNLGDLAHAAHKGARLTGAATGKAWREGYVARGKNLCLATGSADVLPALKEAAAALSGGGLPASMFSGTAGGPVVGFFRAKQMSGAFAVTATGDGLRLAGRMLTLPAKLVAARDGDPLAKFEANAPLVLSASLDPAAITADGGPLGGALAAAFAGCKSCDRAAVAGALAQLRPQLSGSTGLVVTRVDPAAASSANASYFMFPHAYLFAVKSSATARSAVQAAVEKLKAGGVRMAETQGLGEGPHYAAEVGAHQVMVGVGGGVIYVANDRAARDLALQAAAAAPPGRAASAARLVVNGPALTGALRRISPLDLLKAPELATLFGFGIEAGALLRAAGTMTGTAEPDGKGARFEFGFKFAE